MNSFPSCIFFFFFNDTATTEIYTLSLHDALPILSASALACGMKPSTWMFDLRNSSAALSPSAIRPINRTSNRSEEHTSELQSRLHLVCRLLLEKKKKKKNKLYKHIYK